MTKKQLKIWLIVFMILLGVSMSLNFYYISKYDLLKERARKTIGSLYFEKQTCLKQLRNCK